MIARLTSLAFALVVFSLSPSGYAQPFEPTPEEVRHNAEALKYAQAGNYAAAVTEQQKAVAVRGLNVFWLNLGRFQQRAHLCGEAAESYTNAITAPAVENPPIETVRKTAQKYIDELARDCPARVRLICTPADMTVAASREGDSNPPTPMACGQESSLEGGAWRFVGTYGAETTEVSYDLRIAREYEIPLQIGKPVARVQADGEPHNGTADVAAVVPAAPRKPVNGAAIGLIIGATVALFAGLALDVAPPSAHNGEFDALDYVPVGLYLTSITLGAIAVAIW